TPARRYSFLVGKNENSHTAQSRLVPLLIEDEHNPTLKEIEDAFGIEKVTKEFFEKYRQLFLNLKESLEKIVKKDKKIKVDFEAKNVDTVDFAKKLLGQIVFLYFLQKKGWFGVPRGKNWGEGDKQFLRHLFDRAKEEKKNYFNDFLEPMFYQALRYDRSADDDYFSQFDCKIPFLNGGLFDPMNDYDWINTDILLSNEIFSNNCKTKEGDTGTGILDVFDRYNFTVKEDEPLEKEVAVDPEMLGKVFENLLEVKDRKSKGTYYTPREIVHYMCQQSLINYLDTAINTAEKPVVPEKATQEKFFGPKEARQKSLVTEQYDCLVPKEDIELFVKYGDSRIENEIIARQKIENIKNGKQKTSNYKLSLPESIHKNARKIDDALKTIRVCDPAVGSGAFLVGMMHEIVNARTVLSACLEKEKDRTAYDFKRDAIRSCLYGVDIDPGAVEIAKLRLWLSLVVDEEQRETIQPLPNLDYKIVCGNSLLGVQKNLVNWMDFEELERLKPLFFNETNARKKQKYKQQIDQIISKLTNGHQEFDFEIYFSEVFHKKEGFDVVIGNPPWGQKSVKFTKEEKETYKKLYPSAMTGSIDIFRLFVEKSIQITAYRGVFADVLPDIVLLKNYASTRKYILDNLRLLRIDHWGMAFENVNLDSCTIIGQKATSENNKVLATIRSEEGITENLIPQSHFLNIEGYKFNLHMNTASLALVNKLKAQGTFGEYFIPHEGIHSGNIRKKLFVEKKTDSRSKKLIVGRNEIKRYQLNWNGKWVNYDPQLINKNKGEYAGLGKKEYFETPKLVVRRTGDYILAALDNKGYYFSNNVFVCLPKPGSSLDMKYVLGVLNSNVATWFYRKIQPRKGKLFAELKINVLKQIPLKVVSKKKQNTIIGLVNKIIEAKESGSDASTFDFEKKMNEEIYKIFNLNEQEIMLIEREL
ncbi:MAG: Eco57I restriction-modification methylase domain-containing protein, partial [Deltaproteobacteria bacterium]|nr:Eco57I restriction-modification methylase domain-containing protein [Deltaproteobacteria bacterium]